MSDLEYLTSDLPDADAAVRFLTALEEQYPRDAAKLQNNDGLLSDVLTLAAYSPLLSTTLLQNPEAYSQMARAVNPYGDGHAAERTIAALKAFASQTL